jgi:hypothetical protein
MKTEFELSQMTATQRYRYRHPDRVKLQDKQRYDKNPEKEVARRMEWRNRSAENRGRDRQADIKYREKNRKKLAERADKWRKLNPEKHKISDLKSRLKAKYGLTLVQYDEMLAGQNALCALCQKPFNELFGKKVCVDHCHTTGKVRGLLHHTCNSLLGLGHEDIIVFQNAIKYLDKHKLAVDPTFA